MEKFLKFAACAILIMASVACTDSPQEVAARIDCEDVHKVTDPEVLALMLRKCPRAGPAFKPSSGRTW